MAGLFLPISVIDYDMIFGRSGDAVVMLKQRQILSRKDQKLHQGVRQFGIIRSNVLHLCPHHRVEDLARSENTLRWNIVIISVRVWLRLKVFAEITR